MWFAYHFISENIHCPPFIGLAMDCFSSHGMFVEKSHFNILPGDMSGERSVLSKRQAKIQTFSEIHRPALTHSPESIRLYLSISLVNQ